jgi:CRISPR-associated protein (TIGR03986 family)
MHNNHRATKPQQKKELPPSFDITCPYNFVPLSEKVIFPEWANNIYHDIPFSDGLSGEIKYTIKAKSPILIGSGKGKENRGDKKNTGINHLRRNEDNVESYNNKPTEAPSLNLFCKDSDGNYFIPGTSLKGAFRSLLEILSFSKLSIYDDYAYSYRDLSNPKYKKSLEAHNIHCGWLTMESEKEWKIEDCGIPGRISHEEIDKNLGTNFKNDYSKIPVDKKPAKDKYERFFNGKKFDFELLHYGFDTTSNEEPFKKICRINKNNSGKQGTIVFTGQPSVRNYEKKTGKWLEFVFFDTNGKKYTVNEEKIKNFKLAYFNNEPNQSEDWKYWKYLQKKNKDFKIPVFFVPDKSDKNSDDKILHFGLSQLYKLPYKYKISDLIKGDHKEKDKLDFVQCLFGFTSNNDDKNDETGLKGRIQFGHAFLSKDNSNLQESSNINKILSSPKATFFPFYLIQQYNNVQGLLTYDDQKAQLAGFKRYPVRLNANIESIAESMENKKLLSKMRPLPEGTIFEGKVSFHNLKPVELGALLSALTLNDEEGCFHTLGGGKPFGFGKSKVHIESLNIVNYDELKFENADYKNYIFQFNEYVENKIGKSLKETVQYKELVSMAKEYSDVDMDKFLNYMKLENFANIKKNKCYLKHYSELVKDYKNKKYFKCPPSSN